MTLRRDAFGIASPDDFSEVPALPVNWSRIDATTLADSDFTEGELVTASLREEYLDDAYSDGLSHDELMLRKEQINEAYPL